MKVKSRKLLVSLVILASIAVPVSFVYAQLSASQTERQVIAVTNYTVTPDDPNDWISVAPGNTLELVVANQYHFARVGMAEVRQAVPAGSPEKYFGYLPEGDNAEGSTLIVSAAEIVDEATFVVDIDATKTKLGDNFILYFTTVGKAVPDWRWPNWPAQAGTPRSFQVHLHIGDSMEDYVKSLKN
jgi:hypothetical protein